MKKFEVTATIEEYSVNPTRSGLFSESISGRINKIVKEVEITINALDVVAARNQVFDRYDRQARHNQPTVRLVDVQIKEI